MPRLAGVAGVALSLAVTLTAVVGAGRAPHPTALTEERPAISVAAEAPSGHDAPIPPMVAIPVAAGFDRPLLVTAPPGDDRLFVVEKPGRVRVVDARGETLEDPFLDLTSATRANQVERGLLGLAFHPGFAANGRFFVDYTDLEGDTRVVEYSISDDDRNRADPSSARIILTVEQPGQFHNAGMLQFGPDGHLFISVGDGGGIGDPHHHGQRIDSLLGVILRIDVDGPRPYAVPVDNPFIGAGAAEVWAYGLRNPWRFWIDPVDRVMAIGDVGQFDREEITVLPLDGGGANLGWPVTEGDRCWDADSCSIEGFVEPDLVYSHAKGCAVLGGPIYRGSKVPALWGQYLYSDFCSGWVRGFGLIRGHVVELFELVPGGELGQVLSLGTDGHGEVMVAAADGTIYRLEVEG